MKTNKLFSVLVLGGAMLGLGCREDSVTVDAAAPPLDAAHTLADAAASSDGGAAAEAGSTASDAAATGDVGPMNGGFCPNSIGCDTGPDGRSRERPGFMCCWGTHC